MSYIVRFILNVAGKDLPIRQAEGKGYAALHGAERGDGTRASGYAVMSGKPRFVGIAIPALGDDLPTTATLHAVTKGGKRGKVIASLALEHRAGTGKAEGKVYREADATLTADDGTEQSVTVRFSARPDGDWQAAVKVSAPYTAKADAPVKVVKSTADRLASL